LRIQPIARPSSSPTIRVTKRSTIFTPPVTQNPRSKRNVFLGACAVYYGSGSWTGTALGEGLFYWKLVQGQLCKILYVGWEDFVPGIRFFPSSIDVSYQWRPLEYANILGEDGRDSPVTVTSPGSPNHESAQPFFVATDFECALPLRG
jgi:hypothetical protein